MQHKNSIENAIEEYKLDVDLKANQSNLQENFFCLSSKADETIGEDDNEVYIAQPVKPVSVNFQISLESNLKFIGPYEQCTFKIK